MTFDFYSQIWSINRDWLTNSMRKITFMQALSYQPDKQLYPQDKSAVQSELVNLSRQVDGHLSVGKEFPNNIYVLWHHFLFLRVDTFFDAVKKVLALTDNILLHEKFLVIKHKLVMTSSKILTGCSLGVKIEKLSVCYTEFSV